MSNGTQCYLIPGNGCGVTVGGGLWVAPGGADPTGGFGQFQGGGGIPHGYPTPGKPVSFLPPTKTPPVRMPTGEPLPGGYTPPPRQATPPTAAAPVPPTGKPPPPPPPTPVGEPPPDEPFSTFDPYALDKALEEAAKARKLEFWAQLSEQILKRGAYIAAFGSDILNLATYTADLGPSAIEEASIVAGHLVPLMSPLSEGQLTHVGINPESFVSPDNLGLLESLPEITASASRLPAAAPAVAPLLSPSPFVQPSPFPRVGVTPQPLTRTAQLVSPHTGLAPQLKPRTATRPMNVVAPGLLPALSLRPGMRPGFSPASAPLEATQPGVAPNQTDCQSTKTDQKKKGKKKTRNVCWRGTYEERKSGLLKWKKERITCR
ncbi:MAG: hypothetical protein HRJ53_13275 [Acidobacteria bacterium Pan2503]|uniref:Uncharacterized protein n=1 Tax=Candidatus Acidiferrum panamense TaxID=2741543 RepID=A0A7V8SXG8_9BACT|nr:hypothetical protein [Candidatus Acidoferrum panamensis]